MEKEKKGIGWQDMGEKLDKQEGIGQSYPT